MAAKSVLVIGAGIVGAACAARLVMAGHKVTIVDRAPPGSSSTYGNASALSQTVCFPLATPTMYSQIPRWLLDPDGPLVIKTSYLLKAMPWLLRFLNEGRAGRSAQAATGIRKLMRGLFDEYADLLEFADAKSMFHRVGQLYVFSSSEGFEKEQGSIRVRRELGFEQEILLSNEHIRALEPELDSRFQRGVFLPTNGHCENPKRLAEMLIAASLSSGARFISGDVHQVSLLNDGCTMVSGEGISEKSDHVVLAGGVWSNEVLKSLGYRVPLESQRGYHIHVAASPVASNRNIFWAEMKTVSTPVAGGLRIAGTAEIAGLLAPENPHRYELLERVGRQMFPRFEATEASRWMGHRPCMPDSLPVIGPLPGERRVICAFGHGSVGLASAAFTSRLVAEMVQNKEDPDETNHFSIDRLL